MKSKLLAASAVILTPAMLFARPYDCPYFYGMQFRGGGIFMIITTVIIIVIVLVLHTQLLLLLLQRPFPNMLLLPPLTVIPL